MTQRWFSWKGFKENPSQLSEKMKNWRTFNSKSARDYHLILHNLVLDQYVRGHMHLCGAFKQHVMTITALNNNNTVVLLDQWNGWWVDVLNVQCIAEVSWDDVEVHYSSHNLNARGGSGVHYKYQPGNNHRRSEVHPQRKQWTWLVHLSSCGRAWGWKLALFTMAVRRQTGESSLQDERESGWFQRAFSLMVITTFDCVCMLFTVKMALRS